MIRDRRRRSLDTRPRADLAVPAHNRVQHARIVLDLAVLEDDSLLDAHTGADVHARANRHIGAQLGCRIHGGRRVDVDGRNDVCAGLGELLVAGLEGLEEVEGVCGHGGASRLDLAPEVLCLEDEELARVCDIREDVLLEADDLVLPVLVLVLALVEAGLQVLSRGVREDAGPLGAALDGAANGLEDGLGAEEVDAAVDQVGDLGLGLLDVVQHALGMGVADDAAEVGGGLGGDARAQHYGFGVLVVVQLEHVVERERAAHVGVEHEEALRLSLENDIAEVVEAACGAEGLVFAEVANLQLGKGGADGVHEWLEHGLVVVADDEDLLDFGDLGDGPEAVLDNRVAGDGKERLRVLVWIRWYIAMVEWLRGVRELLTAVFTHLRKLHGQRPEPRAARRSTDLHMSVLCAAYLSIPHSRAPTRITALVEGPGPPMDLDRWASEGGCKLMAAYMGRGYLRN